MNHRLCLAILAIASPQFASAADTWRLGEPIVTYWAGPGFPGGGPLDDAAAARLTEGGYTLVWCGEKELEVARRHGLRGLLTDPLLAPETLADPKRREALAALIGRVRDQPSLYAYHLVDEPAATAFPALGELVAFLRERDPSHLAYINLLPIYANNQQFGVEGPQVQAYEEHLRRYVETVRPALLSYDHYQFRNNGDSPRYFLNLAMVRERALAAGVPFMNIVQACSWVPGSAASPSSPRVPGPDELRYLAYTTLAYGAQGISYYVYRYPGHEGGMLTPDGTPTPLQVEAKTLNREFAAIARELQPLRSLAVYHAGMHPPGTQRIPAGAALTLDPPVPDKEYRTDERVQGILLGRFGPPGGNPEGSHVLLVNLDYQTQRSVWLKGPAPLDVYDATLGKWMPVGSRIELVLPGGGGKLVRVRP